MVLSYEKVDTIHTKFEDVVVYQAQGKPFPDNRKDKLFLSEELFGNVLYDQEFYLHSPNDF